jgi:HK97 family phage portal protein
MSLSKRLGAPGEKRNQQWVEPLIPARPAYSSVSGIEVTPSSAIRMSTVYACVRLLGDTISSLPVGAYVRRGRARISYSAAYGQTPDWVNRPNPEASRLEFFEQVLASLNLNGNAFILTVRDDIGEVQELYCINPEYVKIKRPSPNEAVVYEVRISDTDDSNDYAQSTNTYKTMLLTKNEMLHIPMFRLPGSLYGLGPVAAARLTLGGAMAAETYAAAYFGNAANPGGVIEYPGDLTEEQASDIGRDWNISHTGPYRAGKIGILSGGASFKPLSLNAADAQLLDSRRFGIEEVARLFRCPISLLGHPVAGAMSYASVEAQNLSFVQHSLRPLLERLEQSLSNLLPEKDGFIKFNLDALLRGTTIERYDAYQRGLQQGFLSLNDVRATEDLSPLGEAGDQYRVPLQNIDASDAKDVGLKLRADIAASLIASGYDPAEVAVAVGLPPMTNTGPVPAPLARNNEADDMENREVRAASPAMVVNVPDPVVNVAAPNVTIEPAMVMLESPVVNVEAPTITVEAPTVQVTNTIERKRIKKTIIRDKDQRIESVIEEFMDGEQ